MWISISHEQHEGASAAAAQAAQHVSKVFDFHATKRVLPASSAAVPALVGAMSKLISLSLSLISFNLSPKKVATQCSYCSELDLLSRSLGL